MFFSFGYKVTDPIIAFSGAVGSWLLRHIGDDRSFNDKNRENAVLVWKEENEKKGENYE
jgi:hypothetical protein